MKLVQRQIQAIRRLCREIEGRCDVEVGEWWWKVGDGPETHGFNLLNRIDEDNDPHNLLGVTCDLVETARIADMVGRELDESPGGWVVLDCFCYRNDGELLGNVYVLLDGDGDAIHATDDDCRWHEEVAKVIADTIANPV